MGSELDSVRRYALFGVVAREQRHETANLLGLVQAWGNFLASHAGNSTVGHQFARAASAVDRLSRLERALQHCCEGLAGTELRTTTATEIGTVVHDLSQAGCTSKGITCDLTLPKEEALVRGQVGELALALAGLVRLASVDSRHVSLTVTAEPVTAPNPKVRFLVTSVGDAASAAGAKAARSGRPLLLGVELDYAKAVATAFGGRTEGPAAEGGSTNGWQATLSVPRAASVDPLNA